jgi:ABC-2 type transport system ATP-binding protein
MTTIDHRESGEMANAIASVRGLTKRFGGFEAVRDVSFDVEAGEILSILGPNGAGKTTTIRMLMGILRPSGGTATICGRNCFFDSAEVKHHVGYLPDEPSFYTYLTGRELIRFCGEMHGMRRARIAEVTEPLIDRLDLGGDVDEYADGYSHGMKKKLALICALVHDPEFLIFDEPTNGLDPFATRTVHELMREMTVDGKSIFFSTHLLDQAEKVSDRVAILHRGELAAVGSIDELRAGLEPGSSLEEIFFSVADSHGNGREEAAR